MAVFFDMFNQVRTVWDSCSSVVNVEKIFVGLETETQTIRFEEENALKFSNDFLGGGFDFGYCSIFQMGWTHQLDSLWNPLSLRMHSFQVFAFALGCAARADRQTLLQIPWEATEAMLMRDLGATQQLLTFWIGEDYYLKESQGLWTFLSEFGGGKFLGYYSKSFGGICVWYMIYEICENEIRFCTSSLRAGASTGACVSVCVSVRAAIW